MYKLVVTFTSGIQTFNCSSVMELITGFRQYSCKYGVTSCATFIKGKRHMCSSRVVR
jgi:hypothetical protein